MFPSHDVSQCFPVTIRFGFPSHDMRKAGLNPALAYQNGGASAPPVDRIAAVNTEPQMYADFYFRYKCARPMPMYGVPGNIDRF